jgi:hypothetical protein
MSHEEGNGNGGAALKTPTQMRRPTLTPDEDLMSHHVQQIGQDIGGIKVELSRIVSAHLSRDRLIDKLMALTMETREEQRRLNEKFDRLADDIGAVMKGMTNG